MRLIDQFLLLSKPFGYEDRYIENNQNVSEGQ